MVKKDKKKKAPEKITIRLEFAGDVLERFTEFRFSERHESYKDAAISLIEGGLDNWMRERGGEKKDD